MASQTQQSRKDEREMMARDLVSAIGDEFDEVDDVFIDDATPGTWESVAIGVAVESDTCTYWPSAVGSRTGHIIEVNLRRFAPRLYAFVRNAEVVSQMVVQEKPTPVTESNTDNLYDGNLYLLDVWYP